MTDRARPSPVPAGVSGMHLTEGRDGWSLALSLTPELLALLIDASRAGGPVHLGPGAVCRVHVEPNLLPADPFEVDEITVVRMPDTFAPATARTQPMKENRA